MQPVRVLHFGSTPHIMLFHHSALHSCVTIFLNRNSNHQQKLPCFCSDKFIKIRMYPKVKVRQEKYQEDHHDVLNHSLKGLQLLSVDGSRSPVRDQKVISRPNHAKMPRCYVPHVTFAANNVVLHGPIPRVPVTEDLRVSGLASDSSGPAGPKRDENFEEDKVNIRASSIPRPRAVISSPDNDVLIGNKNRTNDAKLSTLKNCSVTQVSHARCKVKSSAMTDVPPNTKKSKEAVDNSKMDIVGKKRSTQAAINPKMKPDTGRQSTGLSAQN